MNLQCAARFAVSDCAEVVLVGHANIDDDYCYAFSGTKVRKLHTTRRDAFKPVNISPIAKIWPDKDKIEFLREYRPRNKDKVELDAEFTDKIAFLKFYPGLKHFLHLAS